MTDEATIQINDRQITNAQSIAVRMACASFLIEMSEDDALGDDEHGKEMTALYRERITEVLDLINRDN